jgi:hypothetical protein
MNARGNGAELWGAESAFEPADIEQREVEFARARGSELRQHLADHAGELEAMARARRRDHDFGRIRKDVDDEVLVGRVREQAPGQPERRSVGIRKHVPDRLAQHLLVGGRRFSRKRVRVSGLVEVVIAPDLEARDVPGWD